MISNYILFLIIIHALYFVSAQISVKGGCPSFDCCKDEFKPLPVEEMTRIWYLYGGVPFFFDADTKCTKVNVSSLSTNYFFMLTSQVIIGSGKSTVTEGYGNFTIDGKVTTLVSNLKFPIQYEIIKITSEYIIMFACSDCGFFTSEGAGLYVYLYTKSELPSSAIINIINAKLEECGIPLDTIKKQDQTSCGQTPS